MVLRLYGVQEYAWTPACCSSDVAVLHKHLHGNYSDELLERRSMSKYVEVCRSIWSTGVDCRNASQSWFATSQPGPGYSQTSEAKLQLGHVEMTWIFDTSSLANLSNKTNKINQDQPGCSPSTWPPIIGSSGALIVALAPYRVHISWVSCLLCLVLDAAKFRHGKRNQGS